MDSSIFLWILWLNIPLCLGLRSRHKIILSKLFESYKSYPNGVQKKIDLKFNASVYFVLCFIFSIIFLHYEWSNIVSLHESKITNIPNVCICTIASLFGSVWISEIIFDRESFHWYTWSHHLISIFLVFLLFSYDPKSWFVSRFYIAIFGVLFSMTFPIYIASVYYYLGSAKYKLCKIELRLMLYVVSIISHIVFMLGQFIVGIVLKIIFGYSFVKWIGLIILQIGVLPSQMAVAVDLYQIIKSKIIQPKVDLNLNANNADNDDNNDVPMAKIVSENEDECEPVFITES